MTTCNKCGDCCRAICLETTKTARIRDLREIGIEYDDSTSDRARNTCPDNLRSLIFINKHWRRISRKEAGKTAPNAEGGCGFYYKCDMLGEDNLCSCYDNRPPVCQGFPMYWMKKGEEFNSQYRNCSFNGKKGE